MIRYLLLLSFCLYAGTPLRKFSTGTPDTLEIYVLRVEFKKEEPDNSLTTGRGLFGSDEDTSSANYSLDPQKSRASADYWQKHLEFANNYYQAVSNGKLVIEPKIFPQGSNSRSYQLDKYIIDYNRTTKRKEEKAAEFDEARSVDYMTFVWDAVKKAAANKGDSPFSDSLPTSPNRKRAYMIVHAGASRLVDGGSMGTSGADTPGDFFDVFVTGGYWNFLKVDSLRRSDSLGIALPGTAVDTLREIMVMSETASQDGLNWGINGILIHQIGRQIGLPMTYDANKGYSRLGYFDVMDLAGYNAGNGFLPVYPSAWLRAYMGWSNVKELRPGTNLAQALQISATGLGAGDEIIKVPLSANEYLLLENRQRTLSTDGKVTITLDNETTKEYNVDSLNRVFLDSICDQNGANCKKNTSKAKGIIVKASHYDMGLPASGVLVWHVNEWFLRETLKEGYVNAWLGDSYKDHQFGLALVEADKVLSIGKEFKNALGEPTYDYGSGSDLLPHLRYANEKKKFDTTFTIEPTGYANTASTFGGLSGIRLTVAIPSDAVKEKTMNGFFGDSVLTWRALQYPLRVEWNGQWLENSEWPQRMASEAKPASIVTVPKPASFSGSYKRLVVSASQDGNIYLFKPNGENANGSDTVVYRDNRYDSTFSVFETPSSLDSAVPVPLYRVGKSGGPLVGLAAIGDAVYSLHNRKLMRKQMQESNNTSGMFITISEMDLARKALLGPMIADNQIWFADTSYLQSVEVGDNGFSLHRNDSIAWPKGFYPSAMAWCGTGIAAVDTTGSVVFKETDANKWSQFSEVKKKGERFQIGCSDFNRDGNSDVFVLGSHGTGFFVSLDDMRLISPVKNYQRGTDGKNLYQDNSPFAMSDINGDNLPDVLFYGHNRIYALDSSGVPLSGFPAYFNRGIPEYGFGESPIVVNADGKGNPEILCATTGGILYAFDSKGNKLTSGWPRLVADVRYTQENEQAHPVGLMLNDADTANGMEIFTTHYDYVQGFGLSGSSATAGRSWLMAGGGLERQSYLDVSKLSALSGNAESQKIESFMMYPNPIRHGLAKVQFTLGAPASEVLVHWYDVGGKEVLTRNLGPAGVGRNMVESIDCKQLGSDLYAVSLEVKFVKGAKKLAWDRVAVVK